MVSSFRLSSRVILPSAIALRPCQVSYFSPLTLTSHANAVSVRLRKVTASENGAASYLEMWRKAMERERNFVEFKKSPAQSSSAENLNGEIDGNEGESFDLERKTEEFRKILEVPEEERDRIYRAHVIDRAAAAISAARAILDDTRSDGLGFSPNESDDGASHISSSVSNGGIPGPEFWSWTPPENRDSLHHLQRLPTAKPKVFPYPPIALKEQTNEFLSIPFESIISEAISDPSTGYDAVESGNSSPHTLAHSEIDHELGLVFSEHAAEAAEALGDPDADTDVAPSWGVNLDGSRWWKETGIEQRPDGVMCRWTMLRGVSADEDVEWQDKFWEAADERGYKELGSEKSGRDANGNVWREFWRESMWEEGGLLHMEKMADKWGRNGEGCEWHEKWWEHHDASNKTEKSAHKWCSIDPSTILEDGHAHVWHERWGERYDGHGGSMKYTDKWAERFGGNGWTKWGDKWDEHFDKNGNGVKQGETWWSGGGGDRWNRTWGERHNGSGWVHKYGQSSSGEHWDTHVAEDTWYEKFPHYGFHHCLQNSVQLRDVKRPTQTN